MKDEIIKLFKENVYKKKPDVSGFNGNHDGKEGHWLEQQFGIAANGNNAPDLHGYELKNQTTSGKTTFGDWSANYYIYKDRAYSHLFPGKKNAEKRKNFFKYFGKFNEEKERFSWSGSPVPTYVGSFTEYGQKMEICSNKDVRIIYDYKEDKRVDKDLIIPDEFKGEIIEIVRWKQENLKKKLESKFNQKGWFTCKKNEKNEYTEIHFARPFNFEEWLELLKKGIVFFDSGMYDGNNRLYSQWRAYNNFWNSLIEESY